MVSRNNSFVNCIYFNVNIYYSLINVIFLIEYIVV